jgi:hypothetical protein
MNDANLNGLSLATLIVTVDLSELLEEKQVQNSVELMWYPTWDSLTIAD